ncbi:MAG: 23S rRNA (uracil(1939)-C(5))-methyltransferase RlmD [Candidatus Heteroscillospira sp.]|jgi:23S rRNA (uracil1939-C5)-methyltransferase
MEQLAKNQLHTARVDSFSSQGFGVCRIDGRAVFLPGALPGELWEMKLLKVTASAVYAKGIKLLESSEHRTEPVCPVYGRCGGCELMHMDYELEKEFKLRRVNDAFAHIGGLDFRIKEILGDETRYRYRNKAIFAVGEGVTGFFRGRSHDIVPVESCLIQSPIADAAAAALRAWMSANSVPAYDEETGRGCVRHIFVRSSREGGAVACVVCARGLGAKTQSLVKALTEAVPQLTGVVLNINKSRGNTVLAGDFHTLWGSELLEETLCGLRFSLSPLSFFQINPPQAERLYERAVQYAAPTGGLVLDLYCGAGTISLCLARKADRVIGAEIVESAVMNARDSAGRNGIENAEFICGDAGDAARELLRRGEKPDAVVLDPPRKGLSEQVIDCVCGMEPERVVYVSCDCATLARDMKRFAGLGYLAQTGCAVDMFPCTHHVECVVLMSRVEK